MGGTTGIRGANCALFETDPVLQFGLGLVQRVLKVCNRSYDQQQQILEGEVDATMHSGPWAMGQQHLPSGEEKNANPDDR